MKKLLLFSLLATLLFVSCKKKVTDEYPEFVGTWESNTTRITIESNSRGTYEYYSSNGMTTKTKSSTGSVKIKNDRLYIGTIIKLKFDITQYPKESTDEYGTHTTFALDNDILYKQ